MLSNKQRSPKPWELTKREFRTSPYTFPREHGWHLPYLPEHGLTVDMVLHGSKELEQALLLAGNKTMAPQVHWNEAKDLLLGYRGASLRFVFIRREELGEAQGLSESLSFTSDDIVIGRAGGLYIVAMGARQAMLEKATEMGKLDRSLSNGAIDKNRHREIRQEIEGVVNEIERQRAVASSQFEAKSRFANLVTGESNTPEPEDSYKLGGFSPGDL